MIITELKAKLLISTLFQQHLVRLHLQPSLLRGLQKALTSFSLSLLGQSAVIRTLGSLTRMPIRHNAECKEGAGLESLVSLAMEDVADRDGRVDLEVERIECDAVSLTTVTQDNFVVIDEQAAQVLNAQSRSGRIYKIYRATKSLIVSPQAISANDVGYDTTNWEDVNKTDERDQDYIEARLAAEKVVLPPAHNV